MRKRFLLLFFILLATLPLSAVAANNISYTLLAPIPGFLPNEADSLSEYLIAAFRLTIAIAGVLAVIMLFWCGLKLMISENSSAKEVAKQCIRTTLLGLLLALSSFMIVNTLLGGAGVSNPFSIETIQSVNTPNAIPGTPRCILHSSNIDLVEGQSVVLTASCFPSPTNYQWTISPGGPAVTGTGGSATFTTAGVFTYTVSGANGVGTGAPSQTVTITVRQSRLIICPEDTPPPVGGPVACAQTNTALDWSAGGAGNRQENLVVNGGESASIRFLSGAAGAYGAFTTQGIVDPNTGLPFNTEAELFVNFSRAQCDFRYTNIDTNLCAASGRNVTVNFQVGPGTPPGTGSGGCILEPNTAYVINIRNEAPAVPRNRGVDTCFTQQTCEFAASLTQSAGAQFVPSQNVVCSLPTETEPSTTEMEIITPQNNPEFPGGTIPIQYHARDTTGLSSVEFTIYNVETGAPVGAMTACTETGGVDTIYVYDDATGQGNSVNVQVPACGVDRNSAIQMSIPPRAGEYRITGTACNMENECETATSFFTIRVACTNTSERQCFRLPQALPAATSMCTPQYGHTSAIQNDSIVHAHQFQLPPNTRAQIVVANLPVRGECCDYVVDPNSSFPVWQCFAVTPVNQPNWCTDGLLADSWTTQTGGTCSYGRNDESQGDLSLHMGISATPGEVVATGQTVRSPGGGVSGNCGTADQIAFGRVALTLTTIAPARPGECLIDPNRDYYANIGSIFNYVPTREGWASDPYGIILNVLP